MGVESWFENPWWSQEKLGVLSVNKALQGEKPGRASVISQLAIPRLNIVIRFDKI